MIVDPRATEFLFSYGTLQLEAVQLATFGRLLSGRRDALPGFTLVPLKIEDEAVIAVSGKSEHTIATFTGRDEDLIPGLVFELSPEDIQRADNYEVADCARVQVVLRSGIHAWVYLDAHSLP
jgi:hypothetical protein